MRKSFLTAALLSSLAFASPALATTVFSDNFDAENSGNTATNYTGFANFDVVADSGTVVANTPSVDLLRQPNGFGLTCAGGAGSSCVDLDGSTNNGGRLITKNAFSFNAGDMVSLFIDVSGSQRGSAENFGMGFISSGGSILFNNYFATFPGIGMSGPNNFNTTGVFTFSNAIPSNLGYSTFNVRFTAGNAGSLRAFAQTTSNDNIGPIIDNFRLDITAVPEPASWALMIVGFGLVGSAMRRRKPLTKITFA